MARSDLLISLVRAGAAGDRKEVSTAVEAIIAEERAKQHNILADRLTRALRSNGSGGRPAHTAATESVARVRDYVVEATPRKRFEDLVLSDVCERACRELVEEQHRASLLRSQSLEPRHRVLLVGPPGNGKTSVAEAIAEALAVSFFVVRYDAIIGSFLGETASRLRRVFDYARTTPCVLFFDEFDAVGKERGDVNETGEDQACGDVAPDAGRRSAELHRRYCGVEPFGTARPGGLATLSDPVGIAGADTGATRAVLRCVRAKDGLATGTERRIDRRVPGRDQLRGGGGVLPRYPQTASLVTGRRLDQGRGHRTVEAVAGAGAPAG